MPDGIGLRPQYTLKIVALPRLVVHAKSSIAKPNKSIEIICLQSHQDATWPLSLAQQRASRQGVVGATAYALYKEASI